MPEKDDEKKNQAIQDSDEREHGENRVWADDIRERGYYYDDSHGYEEYDPDDDESEENEIDSEK